MASAAGRRSPDRDRPNMSDLRIVLMGKNGSENNNVGNTILGTAVFHSGAQSYLQQHSVRISGEVEERKITVINALLLQLNLSDYQIIHRVRECVSLSAPGPYVIVLVLQCNDFRDNDRQTVKYVLNLFSEQAIKHTIVLTTDEETERSSVRENYFIYQLTKDCGGGHVQFDERNSGWLTELFRRIEEILKKEYKEFLHCDVYQDEGGSSVDEDLSRSGGSVRRDNKETKDSDLKESTKTGCEGAETTGKAKLNIVLCGNDSVLKNSVSKMFRGVRNKQMNKLLPQKEKSNVCVKREGTIHEWQISVIELPALIRLSEEEVMRQTHRCVSLCHPGVHVFIIIIPDAPLNNEDKAETEKIQRIFSSRINKHTMILIKQNSEHQTEKLNEETQSVIESFGGRHHFIDLNTQVSVLMEKLEQMVEENSGVCFSTETLMETQMEKMLQFEEMKRRIHSLEMWFQSQDSREREDGLRIVLLGKTGAGKSSSGNTILGRKDFISDISQTSVTKVCHREAAEINSRHITVIDTPGLFDTDLTNEEIQREMSNCISMILPGPHVFLLLIPLGRFTEEEAKSVKIIQETFGEKSLMFTMVLFTRGDFLENKTIEQYLGKPGCALMKLIESCGNRFHVFNNKETRDRTQVTDLLQKIDNMVKTNGGSYYSCKMFREMEREKQEQQRKILMEKVEQLNREREELINKHEEEKKMMKVMMEEEEQNHEKERKRKEEEFTEREERYKRDIKEREEQEKKMREEIKGEREEWEKQKQQERERREEEEKWRKKEQEMWDECNQRLKQEKERMKIMLEEEKQNHDKERKRREEEYREREERFKIEIQREREEWEKQKQQERQNHDKERRRREQEYLIREEQYKRDIKDIEEQERKIREQMRREQEEWEKQKQLEKQREKEEETHRFIDLYMETPEGLRTKNDEDSLSDLGCLRILLFGRTGSGKSATGNTILRKYGFYSEYSSQLVTTVCQKGVDEVNGQSVTVIDTPGLFDTTLTKEQVQEEIMKCISLSAPGPHAIIIVLSVGRFTPEERDTLDMIKMIFGSKAADFCIVLFTRRDELKKQTIEQYVEKNAELKKLISDCGNRFLTFNNTETQDQTQVTQLFNMIKEMNQAQYCTNEIFKEAAISIEKRMKMIEENERKIQAQVEELEARYDMIDHRMRMRLEEKKQKIDEERERPENKFREREETLRREFEEKEKSEQKKRETEEDQKRSEEEKQQRAEYDQRIEEMKRETEDQRRQYEKQQKEREEEDRKREEEYKQDQEKMKNDHEHIMAELRKQQEEEIKKRDFEEQMRNKQEENEREEWKRKIKEAENDKETQDEIKRQQREWEEEKKRQMREREEEERKRRERHEKQLREKQGELEKMREKFERQREEESQMIEEEREKLMRERKQKEREYEEKRNEMEMHYEQLEQERKVKCKRRKREDEERRVEKRKRWVKMMEDLKREQEKEIRRREREERERIDREEQECDEMKQKHEEKIEKMKKKIDDEARKQKEELNDFRKRKEQHIQELKERLEQLYEMKLLRKDQQSCHVM